MKTRTKVLVGVLVLAGLGGIVVLSRFQQGKDAIEVEVEKVEPREIVSIVEASGQIEPVVSVDISSDVIGRVVALGAEEGDRVRKGQFLVQIDPSQYEQRVARTEADLATMETTLNEAEANLSIRRADFQRDQALYRENLVARSRYEASESALHATEAQVETARNRIRQAQAALAESRDQLGKCRLVSPMDGVVIRKNVEVGETAISGTLNNAGSLLLTVADTSVMKTEIEVDETDVVDVGIGQATEVSLDAFPSRAFKGEVTRIGNSAVQTAVAPGQRQSADYKVEVTLKETDSRIRPGLSATARITTARRDHVLGVPIQAIVVREVGKDKPESGQPSRAAAPGENVALADDSRPAPGGHEAQKPQGDKDDKKEEKEGVFVVRAGQAVFTPVKTGITGEKYFEVLEGLSEGDEVVSGNFAALRKLKDGDHVKTEKPKATKKAAEKEREP